MSRTRAVLLTTAAVAAVAAAIAATLGLGGGVGAGSGADAAATDRPAATAEITRETLVSAVTMDGELGYGATAPAEVKATGTITWLPPAGSTVRRGRPLARVDERPVPLLYGTVPMYRALAKPARGTDVRQLEANLAALGYAGLTVDEAFSAATEAAVKRWQRDLGVPATGAVEAGAVVFLPGAVRVDRHLVRTGAGAPAAALEYTATTKVVTVAADASAAGWAVKGTKVTVRLPDGKQVAGAVRSVGTEAAAAPGDAGGESGSEGAPGGRATVTVTVSITKQAALRRWERGPVEVRYVGEERRDVLTVPVPALLALAEGGYGVELVVDGGTRLTAVETGMFAGGRVEVSGAGLDAGMTVRVPA
jgi:peptidoglycan hydrolase-like protein with peptidoglycan-binding domain